MDIKEATLTQKTQNSKFKPFYNPQMLKIHINFKNALVTQFRNYQNTAEL